MNVEQILLGVGYNKLQARILFSLLNDDGLTVEQIVEKSTVTKSRVYQIIKEFEDKNVVFSSTDRPKKYSLSKSFLNDLRTQIENVSNSFLRALKREKSVDEFRLTIENAFSKNSYSIEKAPEISLKYSLSFEAQPFDFLADGKYRFAALIIDKNNEQQLSRKMDVYPKGILVYQLVEAAAEAMAVAPVLFIDPSIKSASKIIDGIKEGIGEYNKETAGEDVVSGFYGEPVILQSQQDPTKFIAELCEKVNERANIVYPLVSNIVKEMDSVDTMFHEIENSASHINALISHRTVEDQSKKSPKKSFFNATRKIVEREKRNKELLKRSYTFRFVSMMVGVEKVRSGKAFPKPEVLSEDLTYLKNIQSLLAPIQFELNVLRRTAFESLRSSRSAHNPFICTIPDEDDDFVSNQDLIKENLTVFAKDIGRRDSTLFRVLRGEEGLGKTHILTTLLNRVAQNERVVYIYASCEFKHEFLDNLAKQVLIRAASYQELKEVVEPLQANSYHSSEELSRLLLQIVNAAREKEFSGVILVIDEFENVLETPASSKAQIENLRKILSRGVSNLGLVVSVREDKYAEFSNYLSYYDTPAFTLSLETLSREHLWALAKHRCKYWGAEEPNIDADAFEYILEKTKGNTRDVIKYLRELYRQSLTKKVLREDVDAIQIPMLKQKDLVMRQHPLREI